MNGLDIKKIRENLKLTQVEFAKKLGVDRRTVINYEKGYVIPPAKILFIEKNYCNKNEKKTISFQVDSDKTLDNEIFILKDLIKTLKESIEDKNKLLEIYINENKFLKEKITKATGNSIE